MHLEELDRWRHDHTFGTDAPTDAERRTRWVVALTLLMMCVEIFGGVAFGSMALLADGWHMGTHAAALGIALFAYGYGRRHATDPRYSFGTGKVGALGGFASAVGLAVVALAVLFESATRLWSPVRIRFDEAIAVAVVGLLVNLLSAFLLRGEHHDDHSDHVHHHHDHNLRGAYLHVLADALTSILAIVALTAGKALGWIWMDPAMGIVGSLVIARWSYGLLRDTGGVLLDAEVSLERQQQIKEVIEFESDDRVSDLHVWRVGPKHLAVVVSIVSHDPKEPDYYKGLLSRFGDLAHLTVELHVCPETAH